DVPGAVRDRCDVRVVSDLGHVDDPAALSPHNGRMERCPPVAGGGGQRAPRRQPARGVGVALATFWGTPPSFRPAVGYPSPTWREGTRPSATALQFPFPRSGGRG